MSGAELVGEGRNGASIGDLSALIKGTEGQSREVPGACSIAGSGARSAWRS